MKKTTRFLSLLLVLCMAVIAFAACGTTEESSTPTASTASATESSSTEEKKFPLEKRDFGGIEVTALTIDYNDYFASEVAPKELIQDDVCDALYNRAKLIEQEYGIKLVQEYAENSTKLVATLREQIVNDMNDYQFYISGMLYLAPLAQEGSLYDLSSIENGNLNLSAPYWDQAANETLSLTGKTYFITGDALVTDDESTWAIFFNKDIANDHHLAENYNVNSLYDLVDSGDWTIDVMYAMSKEVATEDGGDGMNFRADTKDLYGTIAQTYDSYVFMVGCGQDNTRTENGLPVITIGEAANLAAFDKVYNFMKDSSCVGIAEMDGKGDTKYEDELKIFANGRALFMPNKVQTVNEAVIREANIHYGLLPMPKENKEQKDYYTSVTVYWVSAIALPYNIEPQMLDATTYALEAMAYYGKELVTPVYYDRTLKNKRFDDDESGTVLDLIFRNKSYSMGSVYSFSDMLGFYTACVMQSSNTHQSTFDSKRSQYEAAIQEFIDSIS